MLGSNFNILMYFFGTFIAFRDLNCYFINISGAMSFVTIKELACRRLIMLHQKWQMLLNNNQTRRVQYNYFVPRRMALDDVGTVVLKRGRRLCPSWYFFTGLVN